MSCAFTVFPGGPGPVAAGWNTPVYLTATDLAGFGPQLPGDTVSLICADSTRAPLNIIAWAPNLIGAQLPASPPCAGPYQIAVHVASLPPADCLQTINISDILNPITGPSVAQVRQALGKVRERLRIVLRGAGIEPGTPVNARLDPFIPEGSGLLVGVGVVLPFLKGPPANFDPGSIGGTIGGGAGPSDDPPQCEPHEETGVLLSAALFGDVTSIFDTLPPGVLPLSLDVTWTVTDDSGRTLREGGGRDYHQIAGTGPGAAQIEPTFLIAPPLVEATRSANLAPRRYQLSASVTLTAELNGVNISEGPFSVPAAPLAMVPVEIPTVAAFFRHRNFAPADSDGAGGAVFVMVPANSKLAGNDQSVVARVTAMLEALDRTLGKVKDLASIAGFLTGLGSLVSAIPEQVYLAARAKDSVSKLGDVRWDTETTLGIDWLDPDMYVGDRISSLIFLGVSGRGVTCFQDSSFKGQSFDVRVDAPLAASSINNLDTRSPVSDTPGVTITPHNTNKNFENILSSIKFI